MLIAAAQPEFLAHLHFLFADSLYGGDGFCFCIQKVIRSLDKISYDDKSGLISLQKIYYFPSLELPCQGNSNERSQYLYAEF